MIKAHTCSNHELDNLCSCNELSRTDKIKYLGVYVDELINWHSHIDALTSRTRKLIYIFKTLRNSADRDTLRLVYSALCESLLRYCISVWGGSLKTKMLQLERAQRAVLKVMLKKPFRYSTSALYTDCKVLSVRRLFILQTTLRKHPLILYDPRVNDSKRRWDCVCVVEKHRTDLYSRHFPIIASQLYNRVNKQVHIFPLSRFEIKNKVTTWLLGLNYSETEASLHLAFDNMNVHFF